MSRGETEVPTRGGGPTVDDRDTCREKREAPRSVKHTVHRRVTLDLIL